jgi:predicted kinase
MIIKYLDFLNENSKNDPIKEIIEDRVCIILLGAPGLGKSYFIRNYIIPRRNIRTFSTDDVSQLFTKDPNKYYQGASDMNISRIINFIPSGNPFIYDTTGSHPDQIFKIVQRAKQNSYKIIFIHLFGTLELSLKQNRNRNRNVDPEYIEFSYKTQFPNMKIYSTQLKPDSYYVVYNNDGKYKFFKYVDGQLLKRKVDKYI